MKRIELMKRDLNKMDNDISLYDLKIKNINKTYSKILLKDKPVGNSIKAIRHIKNERNNHN